MYSIQLFHCEITFIILRVIVEMSTAVAVDPINERIGSAKADVATHTKEISNIKTEIGKLGSSTADLKSKEDYRGYITKAEALLAKSKADLLKAEREKAAATKIATKVATKAAKKTATAAITTATTVPTRGTTVPKVVAVKSDKTPAQKFELAKLELEEAETKVTDLTAEIASLSTEIDALKGSIAGLKTSSSPNATTIAAKETELKAKQDRLSKAKRDLIDAKGAIEQKVKAVAEQQKEVETVETNKAKEEVYEAAKKAFIAAKKPIDDAEAKVRERPDNAGIRAVLTRSQELNQSKVREAADKLLEAKKELDALGAPITNPSDEEVLAAASVASNPPSGSATTATGSVPGSTPGPSPGLDATVSTAAEEVRFTFLKQRFIVENKFDGDKLLPKQRAFMTAMNILPVMASIDEKELVKVLENIVNNKNCRSDSWIGLSVKCGPIRTLLNTLADRLWVYLAKDPDILSRQARLATGAVGGPGSVSGSLIPLGQSGQSGIPPGGHPFDPENDTIITIRVPLKDLHGSVFGPITANRERMGATGQNTRGDLSNLKTELIDTLQEYINNNFITLESSSISSENGSKINNIKANLDKYLIDKKNEAINGTQEELYYNIGLDIFNIINKISPPAKTTPILTRKIQGLLNICMEKVLATQPNLEPPSSSSSSSLSLPPPPSSSSSSSSSSSNLSKSEITELLSNVKGTLDQGSKIASSSIPGPDQWRFYVFKGAILNKLESIKDGSYTLEQLNDIIKNIIRQEINTEYTSIENMPTTQLKEYFSTLI